MDARSGADLSMHEWAKTTIAAKNEARDGNIFYRLYVSIDADHFPEREGNIA